MQRAARSGGPNDHLLVVGAYLHRTNSGKALPPELAGHSFVAIQRPGGKREAFGFSPQGYRNYDPAKDLGRLSAGVRGAVHDDVAAFAKPGVRLRSVPISAAQATAALAKIAEYRNKPPAFSATRQQCNSFANDVVKAAGVDAPRLPNLPGAFYNKL